MLEYDQIIESLLSSEFSQYVLEGVAYSLPVLSQDQFGNLIDCFFLYDVDFETGQLCSPYARIGIYAERRNLAFYYACEELPFTQTGEAPQPSAMPDTYDDSISKYEELYSQIRTFAFEETLSEQKEKLLSMYRDTAVMAFGTQYQYYYDVADKFFIWMEKALHRKSFLDACLEGDADLEDIDSYIAGIVDENKLKEILGMTDIEFSTWKCEGKKALRDILFCRVNGKPFKFMTQEEKIAARSYNPTDIAKLKHEKL